MNITRRNERSEWKKIDRRLYWSETWVDRERIYSKIKIFEINYVGTGVRVSRKDGIKFEEIRNLIQWFQYHFYWLVNIIRRTKGEGERERIKNRFTEYYMEVKR